jgi:hypothetical protein
MKFIQNFAIFHPILFTVVSIVPVIIIFIIILINNPQWSNNEIESNLKPIVYIYILIVILILNGKNIKSIQKSFLQSQLGGTKEIVKSKNTKTRSILNEPTFIDLLSILSIIPSFVILFILSSYEMINVIYSFSIPWIIYSIIGLIRKRIKISFYVATGWLAYIVSIIYIIIFVSIIIVLKDKI